MLNSDEFVTLQIFRRIGSISKTFLLSESVIALSTIVAPVFHLV